MNKTTLIVSGVGKMLAIAGLTASSMLLAAPPETAVPDHSRKFPWLIVVEDSEPRHIYKPGEKFAVQVTPILAAGRDLTPEIDTLTVTPVEKAHETRGTENARELLFDGKESYGQSMGILFDFFKVPESKRVVEVKVKFKRPMAVFYLSLIGFNMNNQFGANSILAEVKPVGEELISAPMSVIKEGNKWRAVLGRSDLRPITSLTIRTTALYKINLTELKLTGRPVGGDPNPFSAYEWKDMSASAVWKDADGKILGEPIPLSINSTTEVPSPANSKAGYYGLAVTTQQVGIDIYHKEFGFGVMKEQAEKPVANPDSIFGMVHHDINDPRVRPAWIKTLTCDNYYDAKNQKLNSDGWKNRIDGLRNDGYMELPILIGSWKSDADKPVSDEQVQKLRVQMEQIFAATPDVLYYELGLEENLQYRRNRTTWTYFWKNLEIKAHAVREAAQKINPKIKLIYQVAEFDYKSIEEFLKSSASRQFDILSLHPYAWASFPMPDVWMKNLLERTRSYMSSDHPLAIWFSEIGAPHHGNPGGFFGYPAVNAFDNGLSRPGYANYMIRCHVLATAYGVEKTFWYNYKDSADDPYYAERHFGIVDTWGFPKPAYIAYGNMLDMLQNRTFERYEEKNDIVLAYFKGKRDVCCVAWSKDNQPKKLPALAGKIQSAFDMYGRAITPSESTMTISNQPTFILLGGE